MKEELIKYNTAKLADEKGFRIGCKYAINENDEVESSDEYTGDPYFTHEETIEATDNTEVPHYLCPTQSLLQKWIREEKNVDVFVVPAIKEEHYEWLINGEGFEMECDEAFGTYEEALENGLYESLKLIKNEK